MSGKATGWAWDQKGLSPRTKMVLLAIADFCDIYGYGTRPRSYIADQAECSVDTVDRCIKELEQSKLIFIDRDQNEKGRSTGQSEYYLAMHPAAKLRLGPEENAAPPSRETAAPQPRPDAAGPAAYCAAPNNGYSNGTTSFPSQKAEIENEERSPPRQEPSATVSLSKATPQVWNQRLEQALDLADGHATRANGHTAHYAELRRLCEPVRGEPCDWDLDVVPAIIAKAANLKARGKRIENWQWIGEGAIANRDRRLAGLPDVVLRTAQPMRMGKTPKENNAERVARIVARMNARDEAEATA